MTDHVDFRDMVARLGWKCPECGTVYAPSVTSCGNPHAPGATQQQPRPAPPATQAQRKRTQRVAGISSRVLDTNYSNDSHFQAFWEVYPLHKDKARAFRAWRAQLAQAQGAERAQLAQRVIEGAERYRNDPNRDPEHTKYAEGWLSGQRWEDEIGTVAAPTLSAVKSQAEIDAEWEARRREDDARIADIVAHESDTA